MTKPADENGWALLIGTVGLFGGGPVGAIVGGYLGHKLDKYANDRQRYRENRLDAVKCYIKEGYSVEEALDLVNAQTK